MTPRSHRRFAMTTPDWGHTHLSSDAVVAFVDDELDHGPHERALAHIADCCECAAEVVAQRQARTALRGAAGPALPSSLLSSLRSIPQDTELPPPPAGLAMTADGRLVTVLRPDCVSADAVDRPLLRPGSPGTGSLDPCPADPCPADPCSDGPGPDRRVVARAQPTRRLRFGAGAAVSGLALGALAFGGVAVVAGDVPQQLPTDRGVLGGTLLGGSGPVEARLGVDPTARVTAAEGRADRLSRTPRTFLRYGPR